MKLAFIKTKLAFIWSEFAFIVSVLSEITLLLDESNFTPNETELEIISGVSIETEEDIQKAAQIMIEKGGLFKIFLQENLMTI